MIFTKNTTIISIPSGNKKPFPAKSITILKCPCMSYQLPLFPLQLVVFPGEKLNLHVFEPRYKQLIQECHAEGKVFGIPPFINREMMMMGTEIELLHIEKIHPDGEMDVRTRGKSLFIIDHVYNPYPEKLYIGADVQDFDYDQKGNLLKSEQIIEKVTALFALLAIPKDPPEVSVDFSTYEVAHHIGLSLEQEFELLQIPTEPERQEYVLQHLEEIIPRVKQISNIRERALMNGHFRNITPPRV